MQMALFRLVDILQDEMCHCSSKPSFWKCIVVGLKDPLKHGSLKEFGDVWDSVAWDT